jgi:hypothetical protein
MTAIEIAKVSSSVALAAYQLRLSRSWNVVMLCGPSANHAMSVQPCQIPHGTAAKAK